MSKLLFLRHVWLSHAKAQDHTVFYQKLKVPIVQLTTRFSSTTLAKESKHGTNQQRLGDVVWKPEQEFPGRSVIDHHAMTLSREAQVVSRIARVSIHSIVQPARLALLGLCSSGVFGLSVYEAFLLLNPTQSMTIESALFMYKYAVHNFLASCIWETRAPELVAQSLGLDPIQLLQVCDPATLSTDAALQLKVMNVFTARAMLASFIVVTQLLNIVRESGKAALGYSENVYSTLR